MMSIAFERARTALLHLWDSGDDEADEVCDEMLVVADACEEAELHNDAKWLRASYAGKSTIDIRGLVFIGHTPDEVRRASPPSSTEPSK